MYCQEKPGIYVYHKFPPMEINGHLNLDPYVWDGWYNRYQMGYHYYETMDAFLRSCNRDTIRSRVSHSVYDKICQHVTTTRTKHWRYNRSTCFKTNCKNEDHTSHVGAWVVCDEHGHHFSADRLVGLQREYKYPSYLYNWKNSSDRGKKKSAWGGHRKIHTTQERRWTHAHEDEEFAPKARARRSSHNLPDSWWDFCTHNDKNWKTQSKRKRQWK